MVDAGITCAEVSTLASDPLVRRAWALRRDAALARACSVSFIVAHLAAAGAPLLGVVRLSAAGGAALRTAASCSKLSGVDSGVPVVVPSADPQSTPTEVALRQLIVTGCIRASVELAELRSARAAANPETSACLAPIEAELEELVDASWALLARLRTSMTEEVRATVSAHLVPALGDLFKELLDGPIHWIGTTREQRQRGLPDDTITRAVAVEEVESTIVPRLEGLGLPAQRAWRQARMC